MSKQRNTTGNADNSILAKLNGQTDAPVLRRAEGLREFAESLTISYDSAFRKATSGELRTVRFGRRILVPADEVERVMKEGL